MFDKTRTVQAYVNGYADAVQAQCDMLVAETVAFVASWTAGNES
jgi:hypothetical protein